ncbi:MAG: hypothetical protein ABSC30_10680 [Acidimicrobiales bacterium]
MKTRRRILLGAVALAAPITGFALLGTPGILAGASSPSFPVVCKVTATGDVTFTPALTKTGTLTTDRGAVTQTVISGGRFNGCLSAAPAGAPGHGDLPATITIDTPATSLGRVNGARTYATGYCPDYDAATLKALKGLTFTVTWTGGENGSSVFTTTKATLATSTGPPGEVGFTLSAKEGLGSYAEKQLNQITVFFDGTDSAALETGCTADQTVGSATLDQSNSVAIL